MGSKGIRAVALKYAVHNAAIHEGKAQNGPVMGKIMGEHPELRDRAKEVATIVDEVILEVNSWSQGRQMEMLEECWPELMEVRRKEEEKKKLPPLENVDKYEEVRTRFAPNPDGPLHLGSAEPIIFCDEYARMYGGIFVLRYEDTSPDVKAPIPEMYDWIREDVEWLGVKIDELFYQSDRLEIYYKHAEKLLEMGAAYVCICRTSDFKEYYTSKKACPCRDQSPEIHFQRWNMMLNGPFKKGDAVVRIKTDLEHPNPAIREFPALRISTSPHPRTGRKFRVWPLYNFSCAIDDHEMGISHIIRGKEHEVNTTRQRFIYRHLGWNYPEIINVGRLGLEVGVLSKSKIRVGLEKGLYRSWDDPQLGTLRALRRRGLQPEAIRELMIQVGPKPINATLSWAHIASVNRGLIEPRANRYFFVRDPTHLQVSGLNHEYTARLPFHPDYPERGTRDHTVKPKKGQASFMISHNDVEDLLEDSIIRLMGLFNARLTKKTPELVYASYHSKSHKEARDVNASFIHWLPENAGIEAEVVMPDASTARGTAEEYCLDLKVDNMIQFERFGFARVDSIKPFVAYFAHR